MGTHLGKVLFGTALGWLCGWQ